MLDLRWSLPHRLHPDFYDEEGIRTAVAQVEAIRDLLSLRSKNVKVQRELVLTTAPGLWTTNQDSAAVERLVVDVSRILALIGWWQLWPANSDPDHQQDVIDQFVRAGWPLDSVVIPVAHPGFALFGPDNNWVLTVTIVPADRIDEFDEAVKTNGILEASLPEFDDFQNDTMASWYCRTDGRRFRLFSRVTSVLLDAETAPGPDFFTQVGSVIIGETVPDPEEFIWEIAKSTDLNPNNTCCILQPQSGTDLLREVLSYQPDSAIVDFTIPHSLEVAELLPGFTGDQVYSTSLEAGGVGVARAIDMFSLWASSIPTLKSAALVLPTSETALSEHRFWRMALTEKLALCSVTELPTPLFPGRTWSCAYMTLREEISLVHLGGSSEGIYFSVVKGLPYEGSDVVIDFADPNSWDNLAEWMKGNRPSEGFIATIARGDSWAVAARRPDIARTAQLIQRLGPIVRLRDTCTIFSGLDLDLEFKESNRDRPFITGSDLRDGRVDWEHVVISDERHVGRDRVLEVGDILLTDALSETSMAVVNDRSQRAILACNIILLRPTDPRVSSEYLAEYLNSGTARTLMRAQGWEHKFRVSGVPEVSISYEGLEEVPVPIVDSLLSQGLSQARRIEGELRAIADELAQKRGTLFNSSSESDFRTQLNELKRMGQVLTTSVQSANQLEFQVANFYPFPIAYGYRLLAGIGSPEVLYKEQLRVAENILAFLASVSLALVPPEHALRSKLNLREYWQRGISPGHWRAIVGLCANGLATQQGNPLADSIRSLNINVDQKGFGSVLARLIRAKNDFKHDRGPTMEEEYEHAVADVEKLLRECMSGLAFFTSYPIRQVRDFNYMRNGDVLVKCLRYVGDHPGLPQEDLALPRQMLDNMPLVKNDLYIDLGDNQWVPLHPFITIMNCPSCRTREVYMIDQWDEKKGLAYRRSFERGHTDPSGNTEVGQSLSEWGRTS